MLICKLRPDLKKMCLILVTFPSLCNAETDIKNFFESDSGPQTLGNFVSVITPIITYTLSMLTFADSSLSFDQFQVGMLQIP